MAVRPYHGEAFGREKPLGLSILILGESSYHTTEAPGVLPVDWNERIIRCVSDPTEKRDWTISRAADLFFDEPQLYPDQHIEFWRTAAFANFVQHNLFTADGPKKRENWNSGQEPFLQYLIDLRPQFVLVVGCDLWRHLPKQGRKDGPPVEFAGDETHSMPCYYPGRGQFKAGVMPSYLHPNDDGYAFVFGVQHTSRSSHEVWRPWVKRAVETAIAYHERRGR